MASWTAEARRFLEAHRVGHLATAGADGAPHVDPGLLCDRRRRALLRRRRRSRSARAARKLLRLRNLRENPRAAVVVDDWDEDWTRLAFVLVRGPAPRWSATRTRTPRRSGCCGLAIRSTQRWRSTIRAAHPVVRIEPARVVVWRCRWREMDRRTFVRLLPRLGGFARRPGRKGTVAPRATHMPPIAAAPVRVRSTEPVASSNAPRTRQ